MCFYIMIYRIRGLQSYQADGRGGVYVGEEGGDGDGRGCEMKKTATAMKTIGVRCVRKRC
jgi:hypothetical protein